MGDDIEDHRMTVNIDEKIDFKQLFQHLIDINYFPHVSGNDVVWVMVYESDIEIASYQTINGEIYTTFIDAIPLVSSWFSGKNNKLFFRYFCSREQRALNIFKRCGGKLFHIWHEGYLDEYESYKISKLKEQQWIKELGFDNEILTNLQKRQLHLTGVVFLCLSRR